MSINHVVIVPAEEKYGPPSQIIEFTVIGDGTDQLVHEEADDGRKYYTIRSARKLVLLSLSKYEEDRTGSTTQREYDFPAIDLNDLIRALSVYGVAVGSLHMGEVPLRLPAQPEPAGE